MDTPSTPEEREPVSFRFKKDTKANLALLADATGRSQTSLAETAIENFIELQQWQINAINQGIKAADEGQTTPHEDIKAKWEAKRANNLD